MGITMTQPYWAPALVESTKWEVPMAILANSRPGPRALINAFIKSVRWFSNRKVLFIIERPRTFFGSFVQERFLEQLKDAAILVRPTAGLDKSMPFHRVNRHFPVFLAQFDQALGESHHILEMHIVVHHPVQDKQLAL